MNGDDIYNFFLSVDGYMNADAKKDFVKRYAGFIEKIALDVAKSEDYEEGYSNGYDEGFDDGANSE